MEKLPKFLKAVIFQTKWTVIEPNYGPSFIYAHVVKYIGPPKKSKIDFLEKKTTKWKKLIIIAYFSSKSPRLGPRLDFDIVIHITFSMKNFGLMRVPK